MTQRRGKREVPDPIAAHRQFREAPLKGRSLTDFATDTPVAPTSDEVPTPPAMQEVAAQAPRKVSTPRGSRNDKAGWEQQTLVLPPGLRLWLKVHAAQRKKEMSDIAALALEEYRQRHKDE